MNKKEILIRLENIKTFVNQIENEKTYSHFKIELTDTEFYIKIEERNKQ